MPALGPDMGLLLIDVRLMFWGPWVLAFGRAGPPASARIASSGAASAQTRRLVTGRATNVFWFSQRSEECAGSGRFDLIPRSYNQGLHGGVSNGEYPV